MQPVACVKKCIGLLVDNPVLFRGCALFNSLGMRHDYDKVMLILIILDCFFVFDALQGVDFKRD